MTVAFFNDKDSASCDSADTSKALILTTATIPASYTCFNFSDIFSQSNTTGSSNGSTHFFNPDQLQYPNRVDWLISQLDNYDSKANYSRVWYEQNSEVGNVDEGEEARWVLYLYAFDDCKQLGPGDDYEVDDYPWYETSCQTKEGGQCRTVPNTIKSFALNRADKYNKGHGGCETWAYLGSATRTGGWSMGPVIVAVCAAVFSLL